jgi:hypothetical protein
MEVVERSCRISACHLFENNGASASG